MTDSQRQLLILFYNSQPTHTHTQTHTIKSKREPSLSRSWITGWPRKKRKKNYSIYYLTTGERHRYHALEMHFPHHQAQKAMT